MKKIVMKTYLHHATHQSFLNLLPMHMDQLCPNGIIILQYGPMIIIALLKEANTLL
jgi:adenylate kinase